MYKVGISIGAGSFNESYFENFVKSGAYGIEMSINHPVHRFIDYKAIKKFTDSYGVKMCSVHLPFSNIKTLDLASLDAELREHTVETQVENIKKGLDIGVEKFVVHPSSEPVSEDPETRAEQMKCAKDSLSRLADTAEIGNAVIAVENLPRTCLGRNADEMLDLTEDTRLRICFDTNHLLMEGHVEFIEKIVHKTVTLHVSDYDFLNERHWLPGEGKINWNEVYSTLVKCGYSGVWMYEVTSGSSNTITRERALLPEDYVRNATEIFEGLELTKRGITVEGLKAWRS